MTDRLLTPEEIRAAVETAKRVYTSTGDPEEAKRAMESWLREEPKP